MIIYIQPCVWAAPFIGADTVEYEKEGSKEKRDEGSVYWRLEMWKEMYKEMCKEGVLKKKQARAVVQWIIGRRIRLD